MNSKAGETPDEFKGLQLSSDSNMSDVLEYILQGCLYCKILIGENGQPADYVVVDCNKAMKSLMGGMLAGSMDQLVKGFFAQVDLLPALAKAALHGISTTWEQCFGTSAKWYSLSVFSLEKDYAVLVLEDITKRKMIEKELKAKKTRYEALVKQSSDAIALVDAASKKILEVNSSMCQMTGYSEEELCQLSVYNLFVDKKEIEVCQTELAKQRYLPVTNRRVICKNGSVIDVERVGSMVNYNGQQLELLTLYDVSEERKLQQIINEDAVVASRVQRQMLPMDFRNKIMEIKGIYEPLHMVSGDFYDYRFSEDQSILTGFLLDVAGHGLATALRTAAINVLLQEVIIKEKMPTEAELHALNKQMMDYFDEGSFAALLLFHFDFRQKILTCACCGINQVLAFCSLKKGWIKAKGSIMGAFDDPQFDIIKIPIRAGDCFYFLTDGISEKLTESMLYDLENFDATSAHLADLADSPVVEDDCSAVCIKIHEAFQGYHYNFSGLEDVADIQEKMRDTLIELAGSRAVHLEIALNEAINNVLMHGSGDGNVKIKQIGRRVVLRVRDCKQGFDTRAVLQQFETKSNEEIADIMAMQETGRGVLIMKMFTDKMYYSRSGNEVMLVYKGENSDHHPNLFLNLSENPQIANVS